MALNKKIDDFKVFSVKYNETSHVIRQLLIKEHNVRETNKSKPKGKTLFVINVPPFVDDECMRHLFGNYGKIIDVIFHEKPNSAEPIENKYKYFSKKLLIDGYKVAYVVFNTEEALRKVMDSHDEHIPMLCPTKGHSVGLDLWKRLYNGNVIETDKLQNEIDSFMNDYDKRIEMEKVTAKEKEGIPDDDGWIMVTRHGKRPVLTNDLSKDERITEKYKKRKKKSDKEFDNFYSFQIKESKMHHLEQLRKKFEDDKNKVAIMKAARRFKPF